jgi:hypothetical protein
MPPDIQHAIRVLEASLDQLQSLLLHHQGMLPPPTKEALLLDESAPCKAISTLGVLKAQTLFRSFLDRVFASLFG